MRKGTWLLLTICGLLLLFCGFTYRNLQRYAVNSKIFKARSAVVESLRISSLALSDECTSTRNPLEGLCGSMSDMPGAYLYHTDCDLMGPSLFPAETSYKIKVRRK